MISFAASVERVDERLHLGRDHREGLSGFTVADRLDTPALSARRFVWKAISSMTPMIWEIWILDLSQTKVIRLPAGHNL